MLAIKYIYLVDLEKYEKEILLTNNINNIEEEISLSKNNTNGNESLLTSLKYKQTIFLTLCLIVQLNTLDFYIPTLVNHLKDNFNITTSKASLFFLLATIGAAICIQFIPKFTDCFTNFQLMYYGLFLGAFFVLFIPPMSFLPQSYILILIGIFAEGFLSGIINVPCFVELSKIGKIIFPRNKNLQQNVPSSLFNLCFYIGDLIEPVIGSWFTKNFNFQASAYFTCFLNIIYGIIFGLFYKPEIKDIKKNSDNIIIDKKLSNIQVNI